MKTHTVQLEKQNGETIALKLPASSFRSSFFAFSLFKAGSTLLHNMLTDYCFLKKVPLVDIPSFLFQAGVRIYSITPASIESALFENGYGYLGWRGPLDTKAFDFKKTKNVLLVRDPRDRLVSMYFSWAFSHVVPKNGEAKDYLAEWREKILSYGDINDWAQGHKKAIRTVAMPLHRYHKMLPPETTRVYRYEDIIFRKFEWLENMLHFFEIDIDKRVMAHVVKQHDIRPNSEKPEQHIRQVRPGNYKKYFSQETLNYLNDIFKEYISAYGYDNENEFGASIVYALEGTEADLLLKPFKNLHKIQIQ